MMSDLPLDLVEEILSRVSATSLKRLGSTCKRWNALFKDRRFTEKHFRKAPKESMVLTLKENRFFSISVNLNVFPPLIEFKGALSQTNSHSSLVDIIVEVFHCDGLLLCRTNDNRLVAWNPCLGETRWIQPKTSYDELFSMFALGYEKKKSGHSYKILKFLDGQDRINGFEIYEFSSDSWRVLDNVPLHCTTSSIGVSLEGNSYGIAFDKNDKYEFLLCFDFTTERFKRLCLPLVDGHMTLSAVGEKQLSVLSQGYSTVEIWMTNRIDNDIEAVLKWSKSFTVDIHISWGDDYPFFLSFLIDEEKKVALCCDTGFERGKNRVFVIGEDDKYYAEIFVDYNTYNNPLPFILSYVPSLVQIH